MISVHLKKLPQTEYELKDNAKRAARSVTRNIAEGYGRFNYQENAQFCRIARGSLHELIDDVITLCSENYISEEEKDELTAQLNKCIHILNGYIRYLISAKENSSTKKTIQPTNKSIINNE